MFNLLPESFKKNIKTEYKLRRLFVGLVMIIFIQLSFLAFFYPSWVISSYKEQVSILELEKIQQSGGASNISSTTAIINNTNSRLKIIATALDYPKLLPYLKIILSTKGSGISLSRFSYAVSSKSAATFFIEGVADTREGLVSFVKGLKDSAVFKVVDLPVSNLAKDKNIQFTINFTIGS